ncbi:hypothetical protein [Phaeodactylibacter luteus]|uniref:Uncharacterized protein n=1 Tax=Phaeodactylibacter luteus TaxID=1564516 RepID=A0A5C6RGU8_9BACT|nr:hypothetical protein [Phaeodactylibacter luteus]TXB60543.1 hypothetical protein FRY97_20600 [Phaeodactylibacter luteus]
MKTWISTIVAALIVGAFVFFAIRGNSSANGHSHEHGPDTHTHEQGGHSHSHGGDGHSHPTPDGRPAYTYLAMNGDFQMNPNDSLTQNDPRNPSRLVLETSEEAGSLTRMAFYSHNDMEQKLAECGYEFIGSRPDPYYYPQKSKTSIWDVFRKVEDFEGDCASYQYVISRSPHGDPVHMHLRYGDDVEALLALSQAEGDQQFNPWWATYCDIDRTTSCD